MSSTYERLRRQVISGELPTGAHLAEIRLASSLGVSRPTVREALRLLESNGLATSDGRSLRVASLDGDELRSALLMRASLEGLHAELAATRVAAGEVAPAELRRLSELAAEAGRAVEADDRAAAVLHNRAFHQAIDALANSPVSATALDRLWDRILVATERALARSGRNTAVNREHEALLAALETGKSGQGAGIAVHHVRATLNAGSPAP